MLRILQGSFFFFKKKFHYALEEERKPDVLNRELGGPSTTATLPRSNRYYNPKTFFLPYYYCKTKDSRLPDQLVILMCTYPG